MSRLFVLFAVGAAFGLVGRLLRLMGVPIDEEPYVWAFAFGVGVATALVLTVLADTLQHRRTPHLRH